MNTTDEESELELLQGILSEVQDLNEQLARTDERSRMNQDRVENLRDNRISPVEQQVDRNENRSRRNMLILSGIVTALTVGLGALLAQILPTFL